jgi:hypothetical protein
VEEDGVDMTSADIENEREREADCAGWRKIRGSRLFNSVFMWLFIFHLFQLPLFAVFDIPNATCLCSQFRDRSLDPMVYITTLNPPPLLTYLFPLRQLFNKSRSSGGSARFFSRIPIYPDQLFRGLLVKDGG